MMARLAARRVVRARRNNLARREGVIHRSGLAGEENWQRPFGIGQGSVERRLRVSAITRIADALERRRVGETGLERMIVGDAGLAVQAAKEVLQRSVGCLQVLLIGDDEIVVAF